MRRVCNACRKTLYPDPEGRTLTPLVNTLYTFVYVHKRRCPNKHPKLTLTQPSLSLGTRPSKTRRGSGSETNLVSCSHTPVGVGVRVGTSLIWAVDQTLPPGESLAT